jgi:chloride channel 3/4/5
MPKSVASLASYRSYDTNRTTSGDHSPSDDEETRGRQAEAIRNAHRNAQTGSTSPLATRHRQYSAQPSYSDLRGNMMSRSQNLDETSGLLHPDMSASGYRTMPASSPATPRRGISRRASFASSMRLRGHNRRGSFLRKVSRALKSSDGIPEGADETNPTMASSMRGDRVWYDQFTSTDWVHDSIADAYRVKELRSRKDWRGRLEALFDGAQGWILVAIIGCITAGIAYLIDVTEAAIFDYKTGYCSYNWRYSKRKCCAGASICDDWCRWSGLANREGDSKLWSDFAAYFIWVVLLSLAACWLTLQTKTTISSPVSLSTLDENLGAEPHGHGKSNEDQNDEANHERRFKEATQRPPMVYYPAAGSGVAEVKVILSGFVLHGYLGVQTLVFKCLGLTLSVASGLSIGKEGPYVHVATCVGNIACRMFSKYRQNDGKRREVLSASAAAGVAVAFGAPIGGVLFSLEEVSYYFPPKTLFRTFFCCIAAALSLRFLDPYGTSKIVLFEVRYLTDWRFFELAIFILLGILGGATGALFIKASRIWATTFRRMPAIKKHPMFEVFLVAVLTGVISFWNRYTRLPVAELLFELASPCNSFTDAGTGLCPTAARIPDTIWYLCWAFVVKAALTTVTFGIKVPAGIYVPSMVVGGLLGRIVGHSVQWLTITYPDFGLWSDCHVGGNPEACVVPGVYALVAAGATMCGVTRLSVTLAVILFELTGSLEHVLPFSLGVLVAKWTADALEPASIYDLLTDMNSYPFLDSKVRPVFTTELGDITPAPHPNHYIDISRSPLVPAQQLRAKLEHLHMAGELDGGLPILRDGILVGLIPGPDLEFALDGLDPETESSALCLMSAQDRWQGPGRGAILTLASSTASSEDEDEGDGYERERRGRGRGRGGTEHPFGFNNHNSNINNANSNNAGEEASSASAAAPLPEPRWRDQQTKGPLRADPADFTPYIDVAPVSLEICSPMDLVYECFVKLGLRYICVLREGRFVGLVHKKAFVKYCREVHEEKH